MGPKASLYFCNLILEQTSAVRDQDHIPYVLLNSPFIPDRSAHILKGEMSPLPEMLKAAKKLETIGCSFIVMPCNTAHYFLPELREAISTPFVSMIDTTLSYIKKEYKDVCKIGLLATSGTLQSNVYSSSEFAHGLDFVVPSLDIQESCVMKSIYAIKSNVNFDSSRKLLESAVSHLRECGAELIVCACTEIPLVINTTSLSLPILDPMKIFTRKIVSWVDDKDEKIFPQSSLFPHSNKSLL